MFFLPWNQRKQEQKRRMKLYLPSVRRRFPIETAALRCLKQPYFSLSDTRGTVMAFLKALQKNQTEEARGYLSRAVGNGADMEQIQKFFSSEGSYCLFLEEKGERTRTVSLAASDRQEMIFLRLVTEPDDYGKWKIYEIEKE